MPEFLQRYGTKKRCAEALQVARWPHVLVCLPIIAAVRTTPDRQPIVGAKRERVVTGGGRQSVKLPHVRAVNTMLGNLKAAVGGTYHAFAFSKYSHRSLVEFRNSS